MQVENKDVIYYSDGCKRCHISGGGGALTAVDYKEGEPTTSKWTTPHLSLVKGVTEAFICNLAC